MGVTETFEGSLSVRMRVLEGTVACVVLADPTDRDVVMTKCRDSTCDRAHSHAG